jgi:hypothetical protein
MMKSNFKVRTALSQIVTHDDRIMMTGWKDLQLNMVCIQNGVLKILSEGLMLQKVREEKGMWENLIKFIFFRFILHCQYLHYTACMK